MAKNLHFFVSKWRLEQLGRSLYPRSSTPHINTIHYYFTKRSMLSVNPIPLLKFYVRLHNGNGCLIRLPTYALFHQLIKLINEMDLQLPHAYSILFKGKHIKNYDLTLAEIGITENSILHVEEVQEEQQRTTNMDVCLCIDGQFVVVRSNCNDKVSKLKQSIFKLTQIRPKHQMLIFNGKKLHNKNTLGYYKICPNSLICLISTAQNLDGSQILSDYDHVVDNHVPKEEKLLESVVSLCQKKTTVSKTTLFRSDSINKRNFQEPPPIQIEIKQGVNDSSSVSGCKDFNFSLFQSIKADKMLSMSTGHSPFGLLKHSFRFQMGQNDEEFSSQGEQQQEKFDQIDGQQFEY